jgi:hypothetical protein
MQMSRENERHSESGDGRIFSKTRRVEAEQASYARLQKQETTSSLVDDERLQVNLQRPQRCGDRLSEPQRTFDSGGEKTVISVTERKENER